MLRLIEAEGVGDIFLVPVMLRRLIEHPDMATRDVSALRSIRYGAAPIDVTLLGRAMRAFPEAGFLQVYGQTECAPVVTVLAPEDHVPDAEAPQMRSAGRPIATAEIRIVDPEGNECPTGQVGEIAVPTFLAEPRSIMWTEEGGAGEPGGAPCTNAACCRETVS